MLTCLTLPEIHPSKGEVSVIIEITGYSKHEPYNAEWDYTFKTNLSSTEIVKSGAIEDVCEKDDFAHCLEKTPGSYDIRYDSMIRVFGLFLPIKVKGKAKGNLLQVQFFPDNFNFNFIFGYRETPTFFAEDEEE
jgi:hypothetical protein